MVFIFIFFVIASATFFFMRLHQSNKLCPRAYLCLYMELFDYYDKVWTVVDEF